MKFIAYLFSFLTGLLLVVGGGVVYMFMENSGAILGDTTVARTVDKQVQPSNPKEISLVGDLAKIPQPTEKKIDHSAGFELYDKVTISDSIEKDILELFDDVDNVDDISQLEQQVDKILGETIEGSNIDQKNIARNSDKDSIVDSDIDKSNSKNEKDILPVNSNSLSDSTNEEGKDNSSTNKKKIGVEEEESNSTISDKKNNNETDNDNSNKKKNTKEQVEVDDEKEVDKKEPSKNLDEKNTEKSNENELTDFQITEKIKALKKKSTKKYLVKKNLEKENEDKIARKFSVDREKLSDFDYKYHGTIGKNAEQIDVSVYNKAYGQLDYYTLQEFNLSDDKREYFTSPRFGTVLPGKNVYTFIVHRDDGIISEYSEILHIEGEHLSFVQEEKELLKQGGSREIYAGTVILEGKVIKKKTKYCTDGVFTNIDTCEKNKKIRYTHKYYLEVEQASDPRRWRFDGISDHSLFPLGCLDHKIITQRSSVFGKGLIHKLSKENATRAKIQVTKQYNPQFDELGLCGTEPTITNIDTFGF